MRLYLRQLRRVQHSSSNIPDPIGPTPQRCRFSSAGTQEVHSRPSRHSRPTSNRNLLPRLSRMGACQCSQLHSELVFTHDLTCGTCYWIMMVCFGWLTGDSQGFVPGGLSMKYAAQKAGIQRTGSYIWQNQILERKSGWTWLWLHQLAGIDIDKLLVLVSFVILIYWPLFRHVHSRSHLHLRN